MGGMNKAVMLAGLLAAMTPTVRGTNIDIKSREPAPSFSLGTTGRDRGKGRNKKPKRKSGVASAKRKAQRSRRR